MILVDSNVFIDYWKNPGEAATKTFMHNEIAICGVVKMELLRGSKNEKEFNEIKRALDCFDVLEFETSDWEEAAKLFIELKSRGVVVPFQDGLISYLALKNHCEIWTRDNHFKLIKVVKPELMLF